MASYFTSLKLSQKILWALFIWWAHTLVWHFDPDPRIWLTAVGLGAIAGTVLFVGAHTASTETLKLGAWRAIRFYLVPFCVASFAAVVKGHDFIIIFPPSPWENVSGSAFVTAFLIATWLLGRRAAADEKADKKIDAMLATELKSTVTAPEPKLEPEPEPLPAPEPSPLPDPPPEAPHKEDPPAAEQTPGPDSKAP